MLIRRLAATFGRLDHQTLELGEGLNLIQAPNETGKSTWCAFLSAMLYGIDSRQRDKAGFIADKNRYAPWNGAAMAGRMDCRVNGRELTLTRETRRGTAPMAEFSAVYAGTAEPVPGLNGQNCAQELLGVSREVFERSAFIRQSGLGVTQDAELEKRISALVTTGEEDTSYTETRAVLNQQLNRRRHNKTGQIPELESELGALCRQLDTLETQQEALTALQRQTQSARERLAQAEEQLAACRRFADIQNRRTLLEARTAAESAERDAVSARSRLAEDQIPENETIGRLRSAIFNLETVRRSVESARDARDDALKARLRAESAVNESLFAGQSADSALQEAAAPPRITVRLAPSLLVFFAGVLLAAAACVLLLSQAGSFLTGWMRALPWVVFAVIALGGAMLSRLMHSRAVAAARTAALTRRFGTTDPAAISALADTYIKMLDAQSAARAAAAAASATYDALYASLSSNEQGILLEVRRFAPSAFDIPAADALLQECAVRRRRLAETEALAREARIRYEALSAKTPDFRPPTEEELALIPPAESAQELERRAIAARDALAAQSSRADQLSGQIAAAGDPAVLSARRGQLTAQIAELSAEYDAIALAMESLERANTTLQNRFSPALGRRAAEIFSALTGGRYTGVVLDRAFHLATEPAGDTVYRDAQLLSDGAADQLYLAVRLAICELVLGEGNDTPIVLDDALANFDDARCAAALAWLQKEAAHRQILLFTCHTRESALLQGGENVTVRVLTQGGGEV